MDIVAGDSLYCLDIVLHAAAKQGDATPAEGKMSKLLLGCILITVVWVNFGKGGGRVVREPKAPKNAAHHCLIGCLGRGGERERVDPTIIPV